MALLFAGLFSIASFFNQIKVTTPVPKLPVTQTITPSATAPTTQPTSVNTAPKTLLANFTCLNIKSATYVPQLLQGQTLFVGWGSQFDSADKNTWGSYGSLGSSGTWSAFSVSTGNIRTGTNSSLMPLTISPLTSGNQHSYQAGIMTIMCSDGKTVSAHTPTFKDGFAAEETDSAGNNFYVLYVATDGSTYYDSALTKLAQSAP